MPLAAQPIHVCKRMQGSRPSQPVFEINIIKHMGTHGILGE